MYKRLIIGVGAGIVLAFGASVSALSVFTISQGGTGTSTAPTYGQLFLGNSSGGWDYVATSTLGITAPGDGTYSTTSADYWLTSKTTDNLTQGSSNLYFSNALADARIAAGTTTIQGMFSATSPLSVLNGAFSIANAAADGSTKGAASFTANDFDATSGNISIDYTNGQAASGSTKGFLTSADWTTFNSKQAAISWTYPLQYSADTASIAFGTTTANTWANTQTFTKAIVVSEGTSATSSFSGNVDITGNLKVAGAVFYPITFTSGPVSAPYFTATSTTQASTFPYASSTAATISGDMWAGTLNLTNDLTVANGGTGASTFTSSQLLYGNGTNALSSVATSSFAVSGFPANYSGTFGSFVGGTGGTWTYWGLSTSSAMAATQIPYGSSASALASESAFNYGAATDLLTVVNASTTNFAASQSLFVNSERIYGKQDKSTVIASSTLAYFGAGAAATSTLVVWNPQRAITITDWYCKSYGGSAGTTTVSIGSGSATSTVVCGSDVAGSATGLSISVAARGNVYLLAGNVAGAASSIVPTLSFTSQ